VKERIMIESKPVSEYTNKNKELSVSEQRFLSDMKAVDEEMENGGARYNEEELRSALRIK